jgi:hypothetical protein
VDASRKGCVVIRSLVEDLLIFFRVVVVVVDFAYSRDIMLALPLALPLADVPDWFCLFSINVLNSFAIRRCARERRGCGYSLVSRRLVGFLLGLLLLLLLLLMTLPIVEIPCWLYLQHWL